MLERFSTHLGNYGINSVSEMTQFFTGNAKLWKSSAVQVYTPSGNRRYAKTNWRMRHLPKNALYKIDASLVPANTVSLHIPVAKDQICSQINLWKCQGRLSVLNPFIKGPSAVWTIPGFVPVSAIPNPEPPVLPPPPPPSAVPTPLWNNVVFLQKVQIVLLIVALLLGMWIVTLLLNRESELVPVGYARPERRRKFFTAAWLTNLRKGPSRSETVEQEFTQTKKTVVTEDTPREQPPSTSPQSPLDLGNIPIDDQSRVRRMTPMKERVQELQKQKILIEQILAAKNIPATIDIDRWPTLEVQVLETQAEQALKALQDRREELGYLGISSKTAKDTEHGINYCLISIRF